MKYLMKAIELSEKLGNWEVTSRNYILLSGFTERAGRSKDAMKYYDKAIAAGDEKFGAGDLLKSKEAYNEALGIKPEESYPKEKISAIDKMLADARAREKSYNDAIAQGDTHLNNKKYELAKSSFVTASEIKAEEAYPKEKIAEIEKILADMLAADQAYSKAIADADSRFDSKEYELSRNFYLEAQKIKPKESYPAEKISAIDKIISELKAKQQKYDNIIAKADESFSNRDYKPALADYKEAAALMPDEEYPKTKINETQTLIAEMKAKEENYKNAISSADAKFTDKKYEEARADYQKALEAKPGEKYPIEKIADIDSILAEIKRVNDAFDNAVKNAESYFKMKEYEDALSKYKEASEIKPDVQFVKDKIIEINNILLADAKERQAAYDKAIAAADAYYNTKDYADALKEYKNASGIKAEEAYPKRKITEINTILEQQRRVLKEKYDKLIEEADKFHATKIFDQAIDKYKQALLVLPGETYPKRKIDEITKYIIDNAIVDVSKETLIVTQKSEKKFSFAPVDVRARKSAYIFLKIKNLSNKQFKLFLNYGKDGEKSGGVTFNLDENDEVLDYIIRVSVQDRWYRIDNNWLSLYPQGGDIEISSIRISKGD
jgi:tetratricopeptide (TPR) repeat protein